MMQQTSLDAYEQLKDNQNMGKMQQLVYDTIKKQPYSTDKDIAQILIKTMDLYAKKINIHTSPFLKKKLSFSLICTRVE